MEALHKKMHGANFDLYLILTSFLNNHSHRIEVIP